MNPPTPAFLPRLLLTPGEPAGIGADILIEAAQLAWPAELVAVCDPRLLRERADLLRRPLTIKDAHLDRAPRPHEPGRISVLPVALSQTVVPGTLDARNSAYVIDTLGRAARACLDHRADALVTGPVQKSVIIDAGLPFTGHTEFLAELSNAPMPVMMLVTATQPGASGSPGGALRVALATTHLALRDVPAAIRQEPLTLVLRVLQRDLRQRFGIAQPRILVCGLNPHAGEGGHLGWEEQDVIHPVIAHLQREGMKISGPLPADTLFTRARLAQADAVLAMYHDQGLPVLKYAGFGDAVNVTLGLPMIRTSVDHGTALDLAGSGRTDASSMRAAITLAIDLAQRAYVIPEDHTRTSPQR